MTGPRPASVLGRPAGADPAGPGPIVWTIAGTDPSGGAGIQADLKTIHGLGGYGASVITAVLAQNTRGVARVEAVAPGLVAAQIEALAEDLPPAAVKLGMLARAGVVRVVAERLKGINAPVVCDPVLGSTGGFALLDPKGQQALVRHLLPRADLLTPNVPEAEALTGLPARTPGERELAARRLIDLGAQAVLLKGGHGKGKEAKDLLLEAGKNPVWLIAPRLDVSHTHGTGCTLSSAIAAARGHGFSWLDACRVARAYVQQGLRLGGGIGRERGPLFHGGWPENPKDYPRVQ